MQDYLSNQEVVPRERKIRKLEPTEPERLTAYLKKVEGTLNERIMDVIHLLNLHKELTGKLELLKN